jgi:spermidine synthase
MRETQLEIENSSLVETIPLKPWELLGQTLAPDGTVMKLSRHAHEYIMLADDKSLMSSRMHGSEEALATLACRRARTLKRPCVLNGGLGMGFTLRATLDLLPPAAEVVVAEIVPAVVEWNRGPLAPLAGYPLNDKRVRIEMADVAATLRSGRARFDAILLDVDNSPAEFTISGNAGLYDDRGIAAARAALRINGVLAVWSGRDDPKFEQRLRHGGLTVQVERVRSRQKQGGGHHTIFLAHKPASSS